jgi:hypothetical protein
MERIAGETIKVSMVLITMGLVSAALLHTNRAFAAESTGGGETVSCLPGQEANSDLGICTDPVCGPGEQRDPSGNTRYCVPMKCPPGMVLDSDINQCVPSNPPPNYKCPDGSQGQPHKLSTGVTVIECPKTLPPPTPPLTPPKLPKGELSAQQPESQQTPEQQQQPTDHHKGSDLGQKGGLSGKNNKDK